MQKGPGTENSCLLQLQKEAEETNVENVGYSCLNNTNTIIKSVTNYRHQTLIFIL